MQQLKQRVALKAVISPLTQDEGFTYIHHRLKKAADKESVIFTPYALKEIVSVAKGIPRVINVLCDNSLITAYGYGKQKVGIAVVREIVRDFGMQKPFFAGRRQALALGMAVAIATGAYFGLHGKTVPLLRAKQALTQQSVNVPMHLPSRARSVAPAEKREAGRAVERAFVTRSVAKGDTLAKLIKDVYGYVDARTIRMVKKANPDMENENLIIEGGLIKFPSK